ncbi:SDR family oxidoreductase [Mameliella alba]|uniref:SDR family NAD(P)-dependent oxidoreductase n=1 Tax=Mameliella alba TaxID=561184 RepID=UPI001C94ACFC|nr:SDR family NAD(P)-dependent oxidoreductase [Mameliella alba]MBY6120401.1 SDR family oxidoreductase [Mameliella alba]
MTEFKRVHDLKDHRVLITGSARGLGRGIAEALGHWGATVVIADLADDAVSAAVDELRSAGVDATGMALDVTDEGSVAEAINRAWTKLGGLDLLVNNAGVLSVGDLASTDKGDWDRTLCVNATGSFLMCRAMVRRLQQERRPGSIVSLASIAGKRGDPGMSSYSASKFAVVGMTQALAREVGTDDILVNAVCPGVVRTDMIDKLVRESGEAADDWIAQQAIKRAQTPGDIAYAIGFLHLSRAMTGQALNVDGGTLFH